MKSIFLSLMLCLSLCIHSVVHSETRVSSRSKYPYSDLDKDRFDQMNDVIRLYNKSGKEPIWRSEFISEQNKFINRMKNEGAVDEVLRINNSYDNAYHCSFSVIKKENGNILAILFESNFGDFAKILKIYSVTHMKRGVNLLRVAEPRSFSVRIEEDSLRNQFSLVFSYIEDFNERKFSEKKLTLKSQRQSWNLFDFESGNYVNSAIVDIWYQFTNGGVRNVKFY